MEAWIRRETERTRKFRAPVMRRWLDEKPRTSERSRARYPPETLTVAQVGGGSERPAGRRETSRLRTFQLSASMAAGAGAAGLTAGAAALVSTLGLDIGLTVSAAGPAGAVAGALTGLGFLFADLFGGGPDISRELGHPGHSLLGMETVAGEVDVVDQKPACNCLPRRCCPTGAPSIGTLPGGSLPGGAGRLRFTKGRGSGAGGNDGPGA
jgi:hypothetical protein